MTWGSSPEVLLAERFEHPEGLVWHAGTGRLIWVDVFRGAVLSLEPGQASSVRFDLGQPVGCVAPRSGGGLLCGVRAGFGTLSADGLFAMRSPVLGDAPGLQMNDGAVDPAGRFWAGTLSVSAGVTGQLFRLTRDWAVTPVLTGVLVSNGIGWSPDGSRCYYIDTALGRIDVFDFDVTDGVLTGRRVLTEVDASPDGMAIDADGGLWVALWDGGEVRRYTPSGALDRTIRLPGQHVTTCAFGGTDLRTLFIAVSRRELDDSTAMATRAGHIFAVDAGVAGAPTSEFGG